MLSKWLIYLVKKIIISVRHKNTNMWGSTVWRGME